MKIIFLLSVVAFAQVPSRILVQNPIEKAFQYEVVEFVPVEKHHFELKAPNSCTPGVLVAAEKNSIKCQFSKTGEGVAVVNVCDDNKAYCKPMELKVQVTVAPDQAERKPLNEALVDMKEELHEALLKGFISGTPKEIEKLSAKENKPVFLMISTDWCPPCNQSKEFLLSTLEFQKMSEGWLKVYVDGDSADSRAWSKVLPFSYYPTMALLSPDMKEVARYHEEFTLAKFQDWKKRHEIFQTDSYATVKSRVVGRKEGSWWRWFKDLVFFYGADRKLLEQNYVLEMAIVKGDQDVLGKFVESEIPEIWKYDWLESQKESLLKSGLSEKDYAKKALALSGLTPAYLGHLGTLCKDDKQCPDPAPDFQRRVEGLSRDPARTRNERWAALADEYYAQMSYYQDVQDKTRAVSAAKKCVDAFEKLVDASTLKFARYGEQGILACAKIYDLSRVEKLYLTMIDRYPGDPTFISRYVRFLKDEKKDLKKAQKFARKALDISYDYNWFPVALTKVQIDQALGEKDVAQRTIDEAFSRLRLGEDAESIDQRIVARFRRAQSLQ